MQDTYPDEIENLLYLHDCILDQENGYWIKIQAWKVMPSKEIPHGIRYCLTLHELYGERILGYDNAHSISLPKRGKYSGKRYAYDHQHRHVSDKGIPYEFASPHQLLMDFFSEVGKRYAYDHQHRHVSDKGIPYEFASPHQLLMDFFSEVDRVLKEAASK